MSHQRYLLVPLVIWLLLWMLQQVQSSVKRLFDAGFQEVPEHLDLNGDGKIRTIDEVVN